MSTYIHFTEEQKQRAAAVDLEEFLRFRGEKLIPSGREKRLAKDHSVTVRGNEWYDHAEERGGHAVSFVQRFYNLSYPEAVTMLLGGEVGTIYPSASERVEEPPKPFVLPPIHSDMRMYIYTGGEPLVRKKDLIELCQLHPDSEFLAFTNGTLIDEAFCQEMLRVKNFVPAISLEGFETANDGRRGAGVYQKVKNAMALLKKHKLPFGISTCYTSQNVDDVSSEEYFDLMIESGALFVWFFHYMPVGNDAALELLPTPEQREKMYRRIRAYRETKPIFSMDFQNDAEYVGGCIAGGRNYLHINAKGDVEPCVFIHYSDSNIHEVSLLEALKRPLFMAYHDNQPFNENMLRPCPMLENPEILRRMVKDTGAVSTDYQSPETADHLCDKTTPYAERWKPTADKLWKSCGECDRCGNGE